MDLLNLWLVASSSFSSTEEFCEFVPLVNLLILIQVVVWVDPLDGTAEYTQGFVEHVTVLIGIAVDGAAVAGVVHQPFFQRRDVAGTNNNEDGRTVWGVVGLG